MCRTTALASGGMSTHVPGLSATVAAFYEQTHARRVAYIDETYNVDPAHSSRYYTLTAVLVQASSLDIVRSGIREIAENGYWHTSDELRTASGRSRALEMLKFLADPAGSEACVVSHTQQIDLQDDDGENARRGCLKTLLAHICDEKLPGGSVGAIVLEERREQRQRNIDATTKREAAKDRLIPARTRFLQTSPGSENLLWLPDLVCSAHRQLVARKNSAFFDVIAGIATTIGS